MKDCAICGFKQDISEMYKCICCRYYHCENCIIRCDLCGNIVCKDSGCNMFDCEKCSKKVCFCCHSPILPNDDFRSENITQCKSCKPVELEPYTLYKSVKEMISYGYRGRNVIDDFTWFQHYHGYDLKEFYAVLEQLFTQGFLTKCYDWYCTSCGSKNYHLSEGFKSYKECFDNHYNIRCDYCGGHSIPEIKFKYRKSSNF